MARPNWQSLQGEAIRWKFLKQYSRAIECLIQALEITQHSDDLLDETATTLNYLASIYLEAGQLAQAEAAIREALEKRSRLPADRQELVASDYMMLSTVLSLLGRHAEALDAGEKGFALHRKNIDSPKYVKQIKERVEQLKRNLAEAEKRERRALRAPSRSV